MAKLPCEDLTITDEETRAVFDLRRRLYKLAHGSLLIYLPGWFGDEFKVTVAHYPWGWGRRTTYCGATLGDCVRKASLDVDKWEKEQARDLELGLGVSSDS